jgi:hypothetical protein
MASFFNTTSSKLLLVSLLTCGVLAHAEVVNADACDVSNAVRVSSASQPTALTITGTDVQRSSMDTLWTLVSGTDDTKFHVLGTAIGGAQNWMGNCTYPGIGLGVGSGYDYSTRNVTIWLWQDGVDLGLAREAIYNLIGEDVGSAVLNAPAHILTNELAHLNAAGSMPNFSGVTYSWDFNNDGVFETGTGTSSNTSVTWADAGTRTVRVKATRPSGVFNTASADIQVMLAPLSDEPGISISNGASRTNSREVSVNMVWPAYATSARVSNDGAFAMSTTRTILLANSFSWTLEDAGDGVYSSSVYVRFVGPGIDRTRTYTDSIVLDRSPSVSTTTTVAPSTAVSVSSESVAASSRVVPSSSAVVSMSVHSLASQVLRVGTTAATKVLNPRAQVCRISGGRVIALKSGVCRISVTVRGPKGRKVSKVIAFAVKTAK